MSDVTYTVGASIVIIPFVSVVNVVAGALLFVSILALCRYLGRKAREKLAGGKNDTARS